MAGANNLYPKMTQDFAHHKPIISINKREWVALENDQSGHVSLSLFCLSYAVAHKSDRNQDKIRKD
jgi:hypothetical protein